jgi:caa(3)-type oxidase subunit IV
MKTTSLTATLTAGAAMLALWGANWALRSVDLGSWSIAIAIGIAGVQVVVGALFFMELVTASASIVLAFLTGLTMFGLLVGFLVADVATRAPEPSPPPATHPDTLPRAN